MKIIETKTADLVESVVFEVPSSMRTISIILNNCVERFHVSLPVMRFMSYGSYLDSLFILRSLKGVFLDRDGEVYPMILPMWTLLVLYVWETWKDIPEVLI